MKRIYDEKSDEELISMLRDGESDIEDYLLEKYKFIVRKKADKMFILGADKEDLLQEGMIGLLQAVRDYDFGRDAAFSTFATLCVSRKMYNAIEASNRLKNQPLNYFVSIHAESVSDDDSGGKYLIEAVKSLSQQSPEDVMIDRDNVRRLEERIRNELSELEYKVLKLHVTGMKYTEIASVLGRDDKSTDNALARAKGKIKTIINEEKQ